MAQVSTTYFLLSTFTTTCMVSLFHRESYELGRDCPSLGAVKQARTLRLLANTFLDLGGEGQWQKALNAVSLANSEHSHPAGFLLKTSILLQHDSGNERLAQCEYYYCRTFSQSLHSVICVEGIFRTILAKVFLIPFQVLSPLSNILISVLTWGYRL